MKKLFIRKSILEDADAILEIEQACFGEVESSFKQSFESLVAHQSCSFYSLFFYGKLVGFYCYTNEGLKANLTDIALMPELQSQGFGKFMLVDCLNRLKLLRFESLTLTVQKDNHRARKLYEANQFKELELLPAYYGEKDGVRYHYLF